MAAQWKGVHYNDSDMLHMQQEAIRRVRQMQQRAARTVGNYAQDGEPPQTPPAPPPEPDGAALNTQGGENRAHSGSPPSPQGNGGGPAGRGPRANGPGNGGTLYPGPGPGGRAPHPGPAPGAASSGGGLLGQLGSSLGLGNLGEKLSGLGERLGLGGGSGEGEGGNFLTGILGEDSPVSKVMAALNIDNERLILIGLLLVLLNEKADHTLLIALVYLLL